MREREAGDLLSIAESMDEQNISNNENTMESDGHRNMSDQLLGGESATSNDNRADTGMRIVRYPTNATMWILKDLWRRRH